MGAMKRADFQELARIRLEDARVLIANERFAGAYYVAGYAIECALKACIAKQTQQYDFPPDRKEVEKIYVHDLKKLVGYAGLQSKLDKNLDSDGTFSDNWNLVKDWREQSRYDSIERKEAKDFFRAISDPRHGVFEWLQEHW